MRFFSAGSRSICKIFKPDQIHIRIMNEKVGWVREGSSIKHNLIFSCTYYLRRNIDSSVPHKNPYILAGKHIEKIIVLRWIMLTSTTVYTSNMRMWRSFLRRILKQLFKRKHIIKWRNVQFMFILDLKLQLGEEPLSLGDPQPFPRYVEIDRITGRNKGRGTQPRWPPSFSR